MIMLILKQILILPLTLLGLILGAVAVYALTQWTPLPEQAIKACPVLEKPVHMTADWGGSMLNTGQLISADVMQTVFPDAKTKRSRKQAETQLKKLQIELSTREKTLVELQRQVQSMHQQEDALDKTVYPLKKWIPVNVSMLQNAYISAFHQQPSCKDNCDKTIPISQSR